MGKLASAMADVVRTLFFSGIDHLTESEFWNCFLFADGFEAASYRGILSGAGTAKASGFAKFASREQAEAAMAYIKKRGKEPPFGAVIVDMARKDLNEDKQRPHPSTLKMYGEASKVHGDTRTKRARGMVVPDYKLNQEQHARPPMQLQQMYGDPPAYEQHNGYQGGGGAPYGQQVQGSPAYGQHQGGPPPLDQRMGGAAPMYSQGMAGGAPMYGQAPMYSQGMGGGGAQMGGLSGSSSYGSTRPQQMGTLRGPSTAATPGDTLHVSGIPAGVSKEQMFAACSSIAGFLDTKVLMKEGFQFGFAFVKFNDDGAAAAAMQQLETLGSVLGLEGQMRLKVSFAKNAFH